MDAPTEAIERLTARATPVDLEVVFRARYAQIARAIARVIRDPARAEELAVEVLLKWTRHPQAQGDHAAGWLYRTAIRMALDELRHERRRARFERLVQSISGAPTPEDLQLARDERDRVRGVLAALPKRQAELLLLRHEGLSYDEVAAALELNPVSVGTLLARAQHAFRKEYVRRHGHA
jgi:RNA polymerase sigma-70 factor (ECF subfamily)